MMSCKIQVTSYKNFAAFFLATCNLQLDKNEKTI